MDEDQLEPLTHAPYAVVAPVDAMETARLVIEDLEEHGVPPESIELLGEVEDRPGDDDPAESVAFRDLTKSAIAGGLVGGVAGALLGLVVALVVPGASLPLSAGLGFIFGSGVGGAAGGVSVFKYNSAAWSDSIDKMPRGEVAIGVHHSDETVIEGAIEILERHGLGEIRRLGRAD